ncbi:lysylphosphatidylglycerol synthase domain-containing protein [Aquabacter sp. CN5-332]|uniref:lysylphosphatidylglycerol synthase domain-containing protein n=1 Tax=Aquabacter sp. CN5-332 TaxID=3156608 RepID=UPI0032B5FB33
MSSWQERERSSNWGDLWRRLGGLFQTRAFHVVFALAAVALGTFLIYRSLSRYSLNELASAVAAVPPWRVAASAACAAASYLCLTLFDYLGLRYAGKPLPYPKAALASFVSLSLGHTIGLAALSSGAVRYRYYSRWGLDAGDVAKVIVFCGMSVGLGLSGLAGIALFLAPGVAQEMAGLSRGSTYGLALACLAFPVAYVALAAFWRAPLVVRGWSMEMPGVKLALAQVAVGITNFVCVAACLHNALASVAQVDFASVTAAYVVANVATLVTHVPGGLGVIETVVQHLLPGGDLVGPLLVFRFTYFLAPLALGTLGLIASEALLRR